MFKYLMRTNLCLEYFPDSGYILLNDSENNLTTLQSQNPVISFTEAGSYTLSLSVTTNVVLIHIVKHLMS